ncbi:MAG: hypothetical protein QG608_3317 [Actinomycetota bacterium]|nr:hypothetical protein [Actinomycetota bacterium]
MPLNPQDLPRTPVSPFYGYDRGTPVDRVHIEEFLCSHADLVTGHCAEIKDNSYTVRYGHGVTRSTVIDVDADNTCATLHADLNQVGTLPPGTFDCLLLTHTLQLLETPITALTNCVQSLTATGALLITTPTVGRLSLQTPDSDYWRLPPAGLARILRDLPSPTTSIVTGRGDLRACLAMLLGYAQEDLPGAQPGSHDRSYPLIACAVVRPLTL